MVEQAFEGTVTLLFTDVEGSTALTSRSGDAAGRALLRDCEDLIRKQITEHGGREVKSLGDGLMVAFSSARRAINCAVDIQKTLAGSGRPSGDGLRVRMGLNAGEAIHEGDDLFGSAVNAAARIAARAKGSEILVSEVVKTLAGRVTDVEFVDRGRVKLKGFDERFRLYEVEWKKDAAALRPFERTPFVGREAERADLVSFLDGLAQGHGGVVVIGGEPGVGKTRLTEEIADDARKRECRVLVGRCYESEAAPPYIPFVEIIESAMREVAPETLRLALGDAAGEIAKIVPRLRTMFDDIPPPLELPPDQERRYLFNSLWEFIERAASARPLVLILDDVHWADESTLLAAEHISQRLRDIPALVLATYRDTELDVARPLARTLEVLVRQQHAHRISLKRLGEDSVRSMLHALSGQEPPPGLVEVIYAETDGNPFFAEEVFKHLSEEGKLFNENGRWRADLEISELDVPEGVKLVIGRRLERLSESTRVALGIAALTGRRFEYRVVEAVGELEPDDLLDAMDEAERARLIVDESAGGEAVFSFAHELIRQTLLTTTALPRRQRRHLAIARALQTLQEDDLSERAADIAGHLLQAGAGADAAETARFLGLAGRRALDAAAFEEALRHYDNALALHPDEKSLDYARLLYQHGLALRTRGRFEEAFAAWRRAVEIYEVNGEQAAAGNICREIALQLGWIGRGIDSVEWVARGLASTEGMESSDRADLLALMGAVMSWTGQHDEGIRLIDEGMALARELNDPYVIGRTLGARALHHYFFMEFKESIEYGEQAAEHLNEWGALWDTASFLPVIVFAYNMMGRFDDAQNLVEDMLPLCERIGHQVGTMLTLRGERWASRASDPEIFERAARADVAANLDNNLGWEANGYTWLGVALTWKGAWGEALDSYRKGVEFETPGAFDGWAAALLATHLARMGRDEELGTLLEQKKEVLEGASTGSTLGVISLALGCLEATWLSERHDVTRSLGRLVEEVLPRGVLYRVYDFRTMELLAALGSDAAEEWERADEHFEIALQHARAVPLPIEEADICLYRAKSLIRRGGSHEATAVRELVGRASELLGDRGMERYLDLMKNTLSLT
ncbi:MAG: AAA family ATPase [Actinomycetota bacterium]|nr:AAA family ATPase [Actinomycetota bacterium]